MLESTRMFKVSELLYRSSNFAIAKGGWAGDTTPRLACRRYAENGVGYPQTFGNPQWMLLPPDIRVDVKNILDPSKSEVVVRFLKEASAPGAIPDPE